MLKQALLRHTASNDLLKKHISSPFPIFHTSSLIYSPSLYPPNSFFFKPDPLSPHCVLYFFLFPQTSLFPFLARSAFILLPPPTSTHKCVSLLEDILPTYPSLTVMLTMTAPHLPNPDPKMNPFEILTLISVLILLSAFFFLPLPNHFYSDVLPQCDN